MRTVKLKSSLITEASFDPDAETIRVKFSTTDNTYEYFKEPNSDLNMEVLFISLTSADSAGQFFLKNIKGKLPFRKLVDGQ